LKMGFKQFLFGGIPGALAGCALGFALSQIMQVGSGLLMIIAVVVTTIIAAVVLSAAFLPTKSVLQGEPIESLHYE
ncbi:MAG: hypothetical protein OQK04_17645, partial [Kangiellaceae bacterium]|nr:hypothetical protein [Kangiellaceae bacterium]